MRVTVTVESACNSGTFNSTTITNIEQYSLTEFKSPLYTTIPSGCAVDYAISSKTDQISSSNKLSSNVNLSDGINFVVKPTEMGISLFYVRATIVGSSTSPHWSSKLKLYHRCTAAYSILIDDGSLPKTLSGFVGKDAVYTI